MAMTTVRIVGLPLDTNEREVLHFFGIQNEVENGPTGRPCITLLPNDKQLDNRACDIIFKENVFAQRFVERCNKSKMDGKQLSMKLLERKAINFTADNRSVFLTGLPKNVSAEKIFKIYNELVGGIAKGFRGTPLVFVPFRNEKQANGKITFENEEFARKCIELSGRPLSEEHEGVVNITIFKVREGKPVQAHQPQISHPKPVKTEEPKPTEFLFPAKSAIEDNFTVDPLSVHIGGLPKDVSTADIYDVFSARVGGISVGENGQPNVFILSRKLNQTFGQVTFNSEELARQCVQLSGMKTSEESMNVLHINLFKTRTNVQPKVPRTLLEENESDSKATPRKEKGKSSESTEHTVDPCSVHISGLPSDATPQSVYSHFERQVTGISRFPNETPKDVLLQGKDKQTVFKLTFNSPAQAESCVGLSGQLFNGTHKLRISLFKQKKGPIPVAPKALADPIVIDRGTTKPHTIVRNVVYFQGVPKAAIDADVMEVMEVCGEVRRVVIFKHENGKSQGRGLITFAKPASAKRCLQRFDGAVFRGGRTSMLLSLFESTKIRRIESRKGDKPFDNSEPGFAYECVICFETWDSRDMMGCVPIGFTHADQEAHFSCLDCVAGHARSLVVDGKLAEGGCGIPCATSICERALLRAPVLRLLEGNTITQLERRMDNIALMNVEGFESCKSCDFGAIVEASTRQMQFFPCLNPSCRAHFCRICKIDFTVHVGKQCSDVEPGLRGDRERKRYEDELSEAVIRKCKCGRRYQKVDGCNKMTCAKCKTTQCYLCRASGIGYEHFRQTGCQLFEEFEARDQAALDQIRQNARNNRDLAHVAGLL